MLLERCCISAQEVAEARIAGASRVELCRSLELGGVTPDVEEIRGSLSCGIPVNVLVRPRGGDFVYSEDEVRTMLDSIRLCRELGVSGIVAGALDRNGNVDTGTMRRLLSESEGMSFTFHRAFDRCRDPFTALEEIIALGCDRILTSGQESSAVEGAPLLAELVRRAAGRIIIMPGAGITPANIDTLARLTGAVEFHGTKLANI